MRQLHGQMAQRLEFTGFHQRSSVALCPDSYFQQIADQSMAAVINTISQLTSPSDFGSGWILVIAPVHHLTKQLLEQCQINTQRILLISQKQVVRFDNLMRDALTCSTCSAVVSFLDAGSEMLGDYEYLANKYQTPLVNHFATPIAHESASTAFANSSVTTSH
jgi:cell division inhibitor SulA